MTKTEAKAHQDYWKSDASAYDKEKIHETMEEIRAYLTKEVDEDESSIEETERELGQALSYSVRLEQRRHDMWLAGCAGTVKETRGGKPRLVNGVVERGTQGAVNPGGWYGRNNPDNREKFIAKLVSLELNPRSFVSNVKRELKEDNVAPTDILKVWEKLSIYKIAKDLLTKPMVEVTKETVRFLKHRDTSKVVKFPDDYGDEVSVIRKSSTSYMSEKVVETRAEQGVHDWTKLHQALNGHGSMDFLPKPAAMTLFLNPDGSRYLNRKIGDGNPIKAKEKYASTHKVDAQKVMVERIVIMPGSKLLADHDLPDKQTSMYVVSMRKLSNEADSSYYDPDPCFEERVNRDGEWEKSYRWQSGIIMKRSKGMMVPEGAYILSVRDFEMAVLSNANVAENEVELEAIAIEKLEDSPDDRVRTSDLLPRKDFKRLSESEQFIHQTLRKAGYDTIAEMMMVDFAAKTGEEANPEICATIFNTFRPSGKTINTHWENLLTQIFSDLKAQYRTWSPKLDPNIAMHVAIIELLGRIKAGVKADQDVSSMKLEFREWVAIQRGEKIENIFSAIVNGLEDFIYSLSTLEDRAGGKALRAV